MHPIYFYIHQYDYDGFDRSYGNYPQPKPWSFQFLLSLCVFCLAGWGLWWAALSFLETLLNLYEITWWLVEADVAFCVSAIVTEVGFLSAGAWGFVPIAKQPKSEVFEVKS